MYVHSARICIWVEISGGGMVCMYVCMYVCMCVGSDGWLQSQACCRHVCMHACIYVCLYVYVITLECTRVWLLIYIHNREYAYTYPQGRFHPDEPISSLYAFIRMNIRENLPPFKLRTPPPVRTIEEDDERRTLRGAGLTDMGTWYSECTKSLSLSLSMSMCVCACSII